MRWRILALLFFARVGLGIQFQTVGSVGDGLSVAFGLDYAEIGLMIGLFMAPGLFLAVPAGFSGRFASDRALSAAGLAALALGGVVSALAPGTETIAAGRILCGAGFLFSTLYFTKMVADWFEGREIATAMSILVMSWPFGIAMGQIGHAWLAELYSWRVPFLVASIYCGLAALGILAFYRAPDDASGVVAPRLTRFQPREWGLIACAGTAWGAFNAAYIVFLSFGPEVLEARGFGTIAAASVISVGSWIMLFSGAMCGHIADRFGHDALILGVTMTGAMAAMLLLGVPGAGLAASVLFGLIGMAPAGIIMAMAGRAVAPERRAFGMGVFLAVYYAITTAVPPAAGWIIDATGTPFGAILLGVGCFALVLPAASLFRMLKAAPRDKLIGEGV